MEFTKQDLLTIRHGLCRLIANEAWESFSSKELLKVHDKVQVAIDNHSEKDSNKPNLTQEQKDFICYQIGEWYLMMKPLLEGRHNLGHMKEKLKLMVCDDE